MYQMSVEVTVKPAEEETERDKTSCLVSSVAAILWTFVLLSPIAVIVSATLAGCNTDTYLHDRVQPTTGQVLHVDLGLAANGIAPICVVRLAVPSAQSQQAIVEVTAGACNELLQVGGIVQLCQRRNDPGSANLDCRAKSRTP